MLLAWLVEKCCFHLISHRTLSPAVLRRRFPACVAPSWCYFQGMVFLSAADSGSWWGFSLSSVGIAWKRSWNVISARWAYELCGLHLRSRVYSVAEKNMRKNPWGVCGFRSDLLRISCAYRCAHLAAEQRCWTEAKGQKQNCWRRSQLRWLRLASEKTPNYQMADFTCKWKQARYIRRPSCIEITKWHYSPTFNHFDSRGAARWHDIPAQQCFGATCNSYVHVAIMADVYISLFISQPWVAVLLFRQ